MKLTRIAGFTALALMTISTAFARPATFVQCNVTKQLANIEVEGSGLNYGQLMGIFKKGHGYPDFDVEISGSSNPKFYRAVIGNLYIDALSEVNDNRAGSIYTSTTGSKTIFINRKGDLKVFTVSVDQDPGSKTGTGILKMYDSNGEKKIAILNCKTPDLGLFR